MNHAVHETLLGFGFVLCSALSVSLFFHADRLRMNLRERSLALRQSVLCGLAAAIFIALAF